MADQLSMYDVITPVPEMWECKETCRRFGEYVDYPSWWRGQARCMLCSGNHIKTTTFDNRVFVYCDLYERRPDNA